MALDPRAAVGEANATAAVGRHVASGDRLSERLAAKARDRDAEGEGAGPRVTAVPAVRAVGSVDRGPRAQVGETQPVPRAADDVVRNLSVTNGRAAVEKPVGSGERQELRKREVVHKPE